MRSEEELRIAIDRYADMIRKLCFIHLKQDSDVDDVFQSVFLKFAKAPPFHDSEHEKAWLIRVTINECRDSLRSWFRRKVVLSDELEQYAPSLDFPHAHVLEAVMQLESKYRDVIYLYYYEGYKVREIAAILQKKENTIHTWLKRAKEELRGMLGGDEFA